MSVNRRTFLASCAALLAGPAAALPSGAVNAAGAPGAMHGPMHGVLANGLAYRVLEHRAARQSTLYLVYGSGCRHDGPDAQGMAHLLEHAMFRATDGAGLSFDARFKALGLDGKAFTTEDFTAYYCSAPPAQVPQVLALEAARMRELALASSALDVERQVVLAEIAGKDAQFLANQRLTSAVLHGTGYANALAGLPAHIERCGLADLQAFHGAHYAPANAVLVLVGPSPASDMAAWVQDAFGAVEKPFLARPAHAAWRGGLPHAALPAPAAGAPARLVLSWPGLRASETGLASFWEQWSAQALGSDIETANLCFEHTGRLVLSQPRNAQPVARQAAALRLALVRALERPGTAREQQGLRHAVELGLRVQRQASRALAEQQVYQWLAQRTPVPSRPATPLAALAQLLQGPPELFFV